MNILALLSKLVDFPDGNELIRLVIEFYRELEQKEEYKAESRFKADLLEQWQAAGWNLYPNLIKEVSVSHPDDFRFAVQALKWKSNGQGWKADLSRYLETVLQDKRSRREHQQEAA